MDIKQKIAFDCDLTLITHDDRPIYDNINVLRWVLAHNYDVIVWSGGGLSYAEMWVRRLGLEGLVRVIEKGSEEVDIAFDDEDVKLGKVNIKV